jgi:hypothetical protein
MLRSLVKSAVSAQLENALANTNLIVPKLWPSLLQPERHQIGRAYSELIANGQATAAAGIRKVLLKVRGFDFVPEDLRSTSFVKAGHAVLAAHEEINNFYNEPGPTRTLEQMGSSIPIPAFPICMSAVLSVRLGNHWGHCWGAAEAILKRFTRDRWIYYLNQCLPTDDRILSSCWTAGLPTGGPPSFRSFHCRTTSMSSKAGASRKSSRLQPCPLQPSFRTLSRPYSTDWGTPPHDASLTISDTVDIASQARRLNALRPSRYPDRIGEAVDRLGSCSTPQSPLRRQTSQLHEVALKPNLERLVAVDRNRNADRAARLGVDVMAAADTLQRPAARFQQTGELLAGERLHNTSSIT